MTETTNTTPEEQRIINMVRLNQILPKKIIKKTWRVGRLQIGYEWRSSKNFWGRFGGGWNWKLGVMAGGSTIIFDLLICSLRVSVRPPEPTK